MELRHTIDFLTELTYNNNREWFLDHKEDYLHAKAEYEDFVNRLIIGINAFDPAIGLQTAASCSYRIYRDVRFSRDKSPYKTWMGAYMCPGGRKSGRPGYYFHIEPVSDTLIGHHLLAAGLYQPSPKTLRIQKHQTLHGLHSQSHGQSI